MHANNHISLEDYYNAYMHRAAFYCLNNNAPHDLYERYRESATIGIRLYQNISYQTESGHAAIAIGGSVLMMDMSGYVTPFPEQMFAQYFDRSTDMGISICELSSSLQTQFQALSAMEENHKINLSSFFGGQEMASIKNHIEDVTIMAKREVYAELPRLIAEQLLNGIIFQEHELLQSLALRTGIPIEHPMVKNELLFYGMKAGYQKALNIKMNSEYLPLAEEASIEQRFITAWARSTARHILDTNPEFLQRHLNNEQQNRLSKLLHHITDDLSELSPALHSAIAIEKQTRLQNKPKKGLWW
ncbi:MAG: hypothetical protein ACOYK8_05060 [Alphaproteobacteria bacterium]